MTSDIPSESEFWLSCDLLGDPRCARLLSSGAAVGRTSALRGGEVLVLTCLLVSSVLFGHISDRLRGRQALVKSHSCFSLFIKEGESENFS